jgi:SAM-dependent methyltransferase
MNSQDIPLALPDLIVKNLDLFVCPACRAELRLSNESQQVLCENGQHVIESDQGIPLLFWPNDWNAQTDVTEIVKAFYEENPFPGYEDVDSSWSLREKARKGIFGRLLDEQMPHDSRILEVGCGTGQLSNFLGMTWGRTVFGADLCLNSLKLGQKFKHKTDIRNVAFLQMNLFRPVFKDCLFDLVICNGVLHHTADPYLGF